MLFFGGLGGVITDIGSSTGATCGTGGTAPVPVPVPVPIPAVAVAAAPPGASFSFSLPTMSSLGGEGGKCMDFLLSASLFGFVLEGEGALFSGGGDES